MAVPITGVPALDEDFQVLDNSKSSTKINNSFPAACIKAGRGRMSGKRLVIDMAMQATASTVMCKVYLRWAGGVQFHVIAYSDIY